MPCPALNLPWVDAAGRSEMPGPVSFLNTMRCPYLEQILRKRQLLLKVFQADCHVDRKVHRFIGLVRWPTPPCLGKPMPCPLYQQALAIEDVRLRRLIE